MYQNNCITMKNIIKIALCLLMINQGNSYSQTKEWKKLANFPGVKRNSALCFGIGDKIYMGLGHDSANVKLNDFYEYDIPTDKWTKKGNYPGAGLFAPSSFVVNDKGYVCFGANNSGAPQKEVYEYEPTNDKWTKKNNFPGSARYGVNWFLIKDTVFLVGGSEGGSPYLSEVWMYLPGKDQWVKKNNYAGGSRLHGVGFTLHNTGYIGSGISNSTTASNTVYKYNKSSDSWTKISDLPLAITGTIGFELGGKGYIGTGYDLNTYRKEIYEYNDTTNKWKKIDSIPSKLIARGGSISFVSNNCAYLGTGYWSGTKSLNDFWGFFNKNICNSSIKTQPKNQTPSAGNTAVFSVEVIDTPVYYQWQTYNGSWYKNLSDSGQYSGVKTQKLTVVNVDYSKNNNQKFRCLTNNNKTCFDTSLLATIKIQCKTLFLKSSVNAKVETGYDTTFNITPINSSVDLYWQRYNGSKWEYLSNSGQFFGCNTDTLKVFNTNSSNNGQLFRCIGYYYGCYDSTSPSLLTVYCKKLIKDNLTDATAYKGSSIKIGITEYFKGISYKWQTNIGSGFIDLSDAGQYSGVNSDTLSINNLEWKNNNQKFRCILEYKGCSDTSFISNLKILCDKLIVKNPSDVYLKDGENAQFSIISNGTNSTYKWQVNKGLGMEDISNTGQYSGVDKEKITISNITLSNHRNRFRCIVYNDGCLDTSVDGVLNVSCSPIINKNPSNISSTFGSNIFLAIGTNKTGSTYKWQSNLGFGFVNLSNSGQYSGAFSDTLYISNLNSGNNNQRFRCIVGNGSCYDTSKIGIVYANCVSLIKVQPQNKIANVGNNTFLHVIPNQKDCKYIWQSDIGFGFINLSNAGQYFGTDRDTLKISKVNYGNDNQKFRCILQKSECNDTSGYAMLTVNNGSIFKISSNDFIEIYPNPSNKYITIKTSDLSKYNSVKFFDNIGKLVLDINLVSLKTEIDISDLSKGLYLIKTHPITINKKLIKF